MNQPLVILALLAALSCCQTAPAQEAAVRSSPGYSQLAVSNDSGALVIVVGPGGEVTAVHDGEVVPADRVRRDGDHLLIVDEDGTTLYDMRRLPGGQLVFPYDSKVAQTTTWMRSDPFTTWSMASSPRKVIGVTVNPLDATLASQLEIEPEAGFVIGTVTTGFPAMEAGVQPHDVVVEIDGEGPATLERLRDALDGKQVGDTVAITIIRKGETLDLDVGVAESDDGGYAYANSFPDEAMAWNTAPEAYADLARTLSDQAVRHSEELEEAREALEELHADLETASVELANLHELSARGGEEGAEAGRDALKRQAEVERLHDKIALRERELEERASAMQLLEMSNGSRALMVPPYAAGYGSALAPEVDDRLRTMEERLSRLEELLEKLVQSDAGKK